MDSQRTEKEPSRLLEFSSVPHGTRRNGGELVLNRFSSILTAGHDFPGAQAMLYAAGIETEEQMRNVPQVGMAPLMPMATGLVEPERVELAAC